MKNVHSIFIAFERFVSVADAFHLFSSIDTRATATILRHSHDASVTFNSIRIPFCANWIRIIWFLKWCVNTFETVDNLLGDGLLLVSAQCVAAWHPNAVRFTVLQQDHFLPDHKPGWYLYDFGLYVSSQTGHSFGRHCVCQCGGVLVAQRTQKRQRERDRKKKKTDKLGK